MDVSLTELLTTVAVASLVEIIYHVKLVRKIGANISFETFWKNCDQLFRKTLALLAIFTFVTCLFLKVGISWLHSLASYLCCLGKYYHHGIK